MFPRELLIVALCLLAGYVRPERSFAQAPPRPQLPVGTRTEFNLPYVPNGGDRQQLDLYLPGSGKNWPLVVWIHGGGWETGSKANPRPIGLMYRGFAVASVNYRLTNTAPFPAQLEDCKAAIRWLKANAKTYGYDSERIGVWGQSAGGHLASLLGVTGETNEFDVGEHKTVSSRVQAVCDFCGPADILLYGNSRPGDTLSKLIGGPIQENRLKAARASPVTYVKPGQKFPPFQIHHGDADNIVPLAHSQKLEQALKAAGGTVTLKVAAGRGHDPTEPDSQDRVIAFFSEHLHHTRAATVSPPAAASSANPTPPVGGGTDTPNSRPTSSPTSERGRKRVLLVIANHDFFYREYAVPKQELEKAGVQVDVAAATKSVCRPHPNSGQGTDGGQVQPEFALKDVESDKYDAIIFAGGHGASVYQFGFPGTYDNPLYNGDSHVKRTANQLIAEFVKGEKYVCGICHGVSVLAWARINDKSLLQGKNVTAPTIPGPTGRAGERYIAGPSRGHAEYNGAKVAAPNSIGNPQTTADDVVVDGKIITACDDQSASEFGRVLANLLTRSGK